MASRHTGDAAVHRYFELSTIIERAKADGDFLRAIRAARDTYPLMPAVVRQMKKDYGSFDLRTARARPLTLKNLPYVRLPKAPHTWAERHQEQTEVIVETAADTKAQAANVKHARSVLPHFVVSGNGWVLASEEALSPAERPDPAFKKVFPTEGSTLWLDPKGRRAEFPTAPTIALTTDRTGAKLAERGLAYDVYRADVNGDGSGVLFLSREGVLHGYTERLEALLLERVVDMPEYAAQVNRFGIQPHESKNHTRCVALSTDRSRYLVTIVDEAWCCDTKSGEPLWRLRFPEKEGWTEVAAQRSERVGTTAEINTALHVWDPTPRLRHRGRPSSRRRNAVTSLHPDRHTTLRSAPGFARCGRGRFRAG